MSVGNRVGVLIQREKNWLVRLVRRFVGRHESEAVVRDRTVGGSVQDARHALRRSNWEPKVDPARLVASPYVHQVGPTHTVRRPIEGRPVDNALAPVTRRRRRGPVRSEHVIAEPTDDFAGRTGIRDPGGAKTREGLGRWYAPTWHRGTRRAP